MNNYQDEPDYLEIKARYDYLDRVVSQLIKGIKIEVLPGIYEDENNYSGITLKIPKQTIYLNNPQIRIVDDELLEISSSVNIESGDVMIFPLSFYAYLDCIEEGNETPLYFRYQLTTDKVWNEYKSPFFNVECYVTPL